MARVWVRPTSVLAKVDEAVASMREVICATEIDDVLRVLGDPNCNPRVIAGGTDLLMQFPHWMGPDITVVDVTGVRSLGGIVEGEGGVRVGAAVRLADVVGSATIADRVPVLIDGAAVVAGPQIRNVATIGGNICNASPSADTIPPLLVLDAEARILSASGGRTVPLTEFFVGPGRTVLEPGELLESIWIPWPAAGTTARYTKLSPRRAMDLAIVGVAVALWREDSGLRARIGLGAVAPTPVRATEAEALVDRAESIDAGLAREVGRMAAAGVSPISDIRGSADYRKLMVERLLTRLLREIGETLTTERVV